MQEISKFTITQAAKLAGISRQNLYKNYINKGLLSVVKVNKNVHIELIELLRVFPAITLDTTKVVTSVTKDDTPNTPKDTHYINIENEKDKIIAMLEKQLVEAQAREQWLKEKIDSTTALLEDKTKKRRKFLGIF